MIKRRTVRTLVYWLVVFSMGFALSEGEAGDRRLSQTNLGTLKMIRHWNQVAVDASGLDHALIPPGESYNSGEQYGPLRASRAMAIVHIAMFDAVNAIAGRYQSYTNLPGAPAGSNMNAAIAQAAHDTLVALFPSQKRNLDDQLFRDLRWIPEGTSKRDGINLGSRAAAAILEMRANDGSDHEEPIIGIDFFPTLRPGMWRMDPISRIPIALGARWAEVKPFVLQSADQFRIPPPPALNSPEYAAAYREVKRLGGDGVITRTERTEDQTLIGIYWAYDGTPSLCAPPRLYNQLTVHIAEQMGTGAVQLARLLALVNVAMADTGIAVWDSKYYYQFWRPVTGIRKADERTGLVRNPTYTPLGAPASNLAAPNFTPPFPSYPSGHAGFGGTVFQVLRRFYGTDKIPFTFVSDEFNGVTRDNDGNVRPLVRRRFSSLSQAEEENGQSRIYLGIHWAFDATRGINQGNRVGDYVFDNAFLQDTNRR